MTSLVNFLSYTILNVTLFHVTPFFIRRDPFLLFLTYQSILLAGGDLWLSYFVSRKLLVPRFFWGKMHVKILGCASSRDSIKKEGINDNFSANQRMGWGATL